MARRRRKKKITILGWGSLLWEGGDEFDQWHGPWCFDGPILRIEFTRVSGRRLGALTLVIDANHGSPIPVAWCLSTRASADDAACDLRAREETTIGRIARIEIDRGPFTEEPAATVAAWAKRKRLDAVVWTALTSNFEEKVGTSFSLPAVISYIKGLPAAGKLRAAEYVWRTPEFVQTPVRAALQQEPWFGERASSHAAGAGGGEPPDRDSNYVPPRLNRERSAS